MADKQIKTMDETPEPAPASTGGVSLSGDQLIDVIKALVSQNQLTPEKMGEVMGQALADANEKSRQWWDDRNTPDITPFNPLGERDNPRPVFNREIFWLGYLCQENQHTREEIEMLNQLKPGVFPMRDPMGRPMKGREKHFIVKELDPGIKDGRLLVVFPCNSEDERMNLARYDRGRGMVDILLEMVPEPRTEPARVTA